MDPELWYEEELLPPTRLAAEITKTLQKLAPDTLAQEAGLEKTDLLANKTKVVARFTREKAKGRLRVHKPRARQVTLEEVDELASEQNNLLEPGKLAQAPLFLIRMGMELDVDQIGREHGWGYKQAWYRTHLYAPNGQAQPRLLSIFPERLYEGQPTTLQVKAGPSLKVEKVMEASLGSIAADLRFGQVTPVTLGFFGENEQKPYWELQEKEKPIRGLYHFWLLLEQPEACKEVYLTALGEGDLRTNLFTIPVGPKVRQWNKRRTIRLAEILA